jgi:hypothetical protein
MIASPVTPGTRVVSFLGGACRVGLIVHDETGVHYALSARHVLHAGDRGDLYDLGSGALIGERVDQAPFEPTGPFHQTIGMIRLCSDTAASLAGPVRSVEGLVQPDELTSLTVFKFEPDLADLPAAQLVGVGGAVRFQDPYSQDTILFTDVLELRFPPAGADPAAAGEAGALIVDKRDRALGLMISGDRERCFVAPLAPFLAAQGLLLASNSPRRLRPSDPGMDILGSVAAELHEATRGSVRLRADLADEHPGFDPEQPIPTRLLGLLGTD